MPEHTSGLEEAINVGATAASQISRLKSVANIAKAAAAGGPIGAAIGAALQNRHTLMKAGAAAFRYGILEEKLPDGMR